VLSAEKDEPLVIGHLLACDAVLPLLAPAPTRPARQRFEAEAFPGDARLQVRKAPDPAASGGWARRASPGFVGPVVRGPYLDVEPGRYRVDFSLRLAGQAPPGPVVDLSVRTAQGWRILAHTSLTAEDFAADGGYRTFRLDVDGRHGLNDLDLVVWSRGKAEVWVDCIDLIRVVSPALTAAKGSP
jgi:hypothetical protein